MSDARKPLVRVSGRDPKQCRWEAYRGSGPGGQHRNKSSTAVRVTHLASGVTAQASEHKSRERNKREAWKRLGADPKFRRWLRTESARASGALARAEREVAAAMRPHNLTVERRDDGGRWTEWSRSDPDWVEGVE